MEMDRHEFIESEITRAWEGEDVKNIFDSLFGPKLNAFPSAETN